MRDSEDQKQWKISFYENVVSDPQLKNLAWKLAEDAHDQESGPLTVGDFQAARRYLRQCVLNASERELAMMEPHEFAGLLARGAEGAFKYRVSAALPPAARRRRKR